MAEHTKDYHEHPERCSRDLQALYAVADAVRFSTDASILTHMALITTLKVSGLDAGRVYVLGEDDSLLRLTAHQGLPEESLEGVKVYAPGQGIVGKIFQQNEVFMIRGDSRDPQRAAFDCMAEEAFSEFKSEIGVPIVIKERPVGVLYLHARSTCQFTPQDLTLFTAIGRQIGAGIENAWLHEESQRSLERIRALREIDLAIVNTMDLETVLNVLLEKTERFLAQNAVSSIRLVDKKTGILEPVACRNLDEIEWKEVLGKKTGLSDVVFDTGLPLVIRNVQTDPRTRDPSFFIRRELVSYIGAPLIVEDKVLGVLGYYTKKERRFSRHEIDFFVTLAGQAAIGIYKCQLFEEIKNQAVKLAKSNKVKDEFLGVMSHELRTPLSSIMGYASLLKDEALGKNSPQQAKAAQIIRKKANDLLFMIRSILETTNLESGATERNQGWVELARMLEDLREGYDLLKDATDIDLRWHCGGDLPVIFTDGEKLKQILQNLIDNALKFTNQGSVTVSAHYLRDRKAVQFAVTDTGIGISQPMIPVVFDKFRQVDSSDKRLYEGVGLGLFIVKKFTEVLGGEITVDSEVGRGSTFQITLPCVDSVAEVAATLFAARANL